MHQDEGKMRDQTGTEDIEMRVTKARFEKVWTELGLEGAAAPWFDRLMTAYGQVGRAYHNARHLNECLAGLDAARHLVKDAPAVEFALWFHDAVYDSRATDNEERSADLALECLREAGSRDDTRGAKIHDLVMLTKTHQAEPDTDGAVMVDVDLVILGQLWPRFEEYDRAIRREYDWVPAGLYAQKRSDVLRKFLQRNFIYRTRLFREKYEAQARSNLVRKLELSKIEGGASVESGVGRQSRGG
jgi:predicted metal-dependent HD superfamily phosphohydrolase